MNLQLATVVHIRSKEGVAIYSSYTSLVWSVVRSHDAFPIDGRRNMHLDADAQQNHIACTRILKIFSDWLLTSEIRK